MATFPFCRIPLALFSLVAFIANIAMMISIYKNNSMKRSMAFIFTCIGMINAVSAVLFVTTFHPDFTAGVTFTETIVTDSSVIILALFQLQSNAALAYDRYLAVSQPLEYRLNATLKKLKKRFWIASIVVIMLAGVTAYLGALYQYRKASLMVVGSFRLITFAYFGVIYYKIFSTFKKNQSNIENALPSAQPALQRIRAKQERHLISVCVAVTGSFIILNLPVTVISYIYDLNEFFSASCSTAVGIITSVCVSFDAINMAFDPFWYFWMKRCNQSSSQQPHTRMIELQASTATRTQKNDNNEVKPSTASREKSDGNDQPANAQVIESESSTATNRKCNENI